MNHDIHPASERGAPKPASEQAHLECDGDETEHRRDKRHDRLKDSLDAPQYDSFMRIIRR